MLSSSINIMASIAGVPIQASQGVNHEGGVGQSLATLAAMKTTLTTAAATSVVTVDGVVTTAVAGIADAGKFDAVWSGGSRRGMILTSHTATTYTFDRTSGAGDAFPTVQGTEIYICPVTKIDATVPYLEMLTWAVTSDQAAIITFVGTDGTTVITTATLAAGQFSFWVNGQGTNPITANLGVIRVSSSSVIPANVAIGIAYDSTSAA